MKQSRPAVGFKKCPSCGTVIRRSDILKPEGSYTGCVICSKCLLSTAGNTYGDLQYRWNNRINLVNAVSSLLGGIF